MDSGRPRFAADRSKRDVLAARFFDALRHGNVDRLRQMLAADVQAVRDSGGKAPALAKSVVGADNVARVLASIEATHARRRSRPDRPGTPERRSPGITT